MRKFLFWFISLTWGLPMTLIGLVATLILLCRGYKPKKCRQTFYFEVGEHSWGGLTLGAVIIVAARSSEECIAHEYGHCVQNLIWGVFMPFFVCIPSAVRYWMYESKTYNDLIYNGCIFILLLQSVSLFLLGQTIFPVKCFGAFMTIYSYFFGVWYFADERFKFEDGNKPNYYDIWFEENANKLGNKFFPINY